MKFSLRLDLVTHTDCRLALFSRNDIKSYLFIYLIIYLFIYLLSSMFYGFNLYVLNKKIIDLDHGIFFSFNMYFFLLVIQIGIYPNLFSRYPLIG